MGKITTEEYAAKFENVSTLERMGISIEGVKFGNVLRGLKKALGMGLSPKKKIGPGGEL